MTVYVVELYWDNGYRSQFCGAFTAREKAEAEVRRLQRVAGYPYDAPLTDDSDGDRSYGISPYEIDAPLVQTARTEAAGV